MINLGRAVGLFNRFSPKISKGIGQVANIARNVGQAVQNVRNIGSTVNSWSYRFIPIWSENSRNNK
jgi:hypothetical protein